MTVEDPLDSFDVHRNSHKWCRLTRRVGRERRVGGVRVTPSFLVLFFFLTASGCSSDPSVRRGVGEDAGRDVAGRDQEVQDYDSGSLDSSTLPADAGIMPDSSGTHDASGSGFDARIDARPADAPFDDSPPVSLYCGDSIRDPVTEECDDGTDNLDDPCTSTCRAHDVHVVAAPAADAGSLFQRDLGSGRHTTSASDLGFGVTFMEHHPSTQVWLQAFDPWGRRQAAAVNVGAAGLPTGAANPVVAALPNGRFAISWTDGASGTPDIALQIIAAGAVPTGSPVLTHDVTAGTQTDPDVLWTGSELVAGWTDSFDVKYRRFDANLAPLDVEQSLASTSAFEGNVALAPVTGGWAAAWRADDAGFESVHVRVGSTEWTTGWENPGPQDDHPAVMALDATHLFLLTTFGTYPDGSPGTVGRLYWAVLDAGAPGLVTVTPLIPTTAPYNASPELEQRKPSAMRIGSRLFLSWEADSPLGDPNGTEVFLEQINWSPNSPGQISQLNEWPAPLDSTRLGDQRNLGLGASPLLPDGALIGVWEDYSGGGTGANPVPDLFLGFHPVPIVSLGPLDAGDAG